MDYYSLLGINKSASQEELKKAYKKSSMQHHPDRGGDEEKFKEINEAYATLKDPQKRAGYDRFGTSDPQQQQQQGGFQYQHNGNNINPNDPGFQDVFNQMFGNGHPFGGRRPQPMKNEDIHLSIDLGLDEVFSGKTIRVSYNLNVGGQQTHEITIPPGIHEVIRYQGLGNNSINNIPRGDLYAKIRIRNSSNWQRDGLNLHTVVPISVFDLLLGTEVTIKTPEGKNLSVKVPRGSQPSVVFSIHGYGIPDPRAGRRGIIFVNLKTKIPKIEDPELIERITTLKKDLTDNV
tara:strand:+ start:7520 stop:8389 length:870 start_codon:yes stop_codon:yes gene_type:complete